MASNYEESESAVSVHSASMKTIDELYQLGRYQLRRLVAELDQVPIDKIPNRYRLSVLSTYVFNKLHGIPATLEDKAELDELLNEVEEEEELEEEDEKEEEEKPEEEAAKDPSHTVDVLSEMSLDGKLGKLFKSATDKNKARFAIGVMFLIRSLGSKGDPLTRNELFSVTRNLTLTKTVNEQLHSKTWQRDFLQRAESKGYIVSEQMGSTRIYRSVEPTTALQDMLLDVIRGDGLYLKKLLWPSHYPEDEVEEEEVVVEEEIPETVSSAEQTEQPRESDDLAVFKEVASQLSAVALGMTTMLTEFKDLKVRQELREEAEDARVKSFTDSTAQVASNLRMIQFSIRTDLLQQVKACLDRQVEIDTRRKGLMNQLEAESRKTEKNIEDMRLLLQRLADDNGGKSS